METYIIEVREFDSEAICDLRGCLEAAEYKKLFVIMGQQVTLHTGTSLLRQVMSITS